MFLLLNLGDASVLESPLNHIGVAAGALDELGLVQGGPEVGEILQLDEVPDVGERCSDHGALDHGRGGWNRSGSHLWR